MTISKRVVLRFKSNQVDKPIIYKLVKDYNLITNILKAEINPRKEGYLVMELTGENDDYLAGVEFLISLGISVDGLNQEVKWFEGKCIQCGACTGICPTQSLYIERPSMNVNFDGEKCIVCRMCLKGCPAKAVELYF